MTDLHALLVLQRHDTAADQLRHRRATLPERALVAGIEAEHTRLRSELGAATTDHDRLAADQARLEGDVAVGEDKRRTLERRLASTSVPREAQAMSDEIDGLKARQSAMEDELLELMEALEPLDARLASGTDEEATLDERLAAARAALTQAEAGVDAELATVGAARVQAAAQLPAPLLERYERLRSKLGGVAVATLDGPRCTGCSLVLPLLELERVRAASPDAIVECEQCGRILVTH
jgi:predicted  nucleic acid-binding Zn-ribbon protein